MRSARVSLPGGFEAVDALTRAVRRVLADVPR